jgi:ABC-type Fe3+-hydroxamate transport system substrate-binding protein
VKTGAMTLGAVIVLSACASDSKTASTTSRATAASTTVATAKHTTTTAMAPATATTNAATGSLGGESVVALRMCVSALVDDPGAPGAKFVEKVQKLSVGYSMVEPLAAAQSLCNEAAAQLKAESGDAGSPLLAVAEDINTALDLAAGQIRTDGFYFGGSLPAQFIPDGASALRQSIEQFYSRVSVVLG